MAERLEYEDAVLNHAISVLATCEVEWSKPTNLQRECMANVNFLIHQMRDNPLRYGQTVRLYCAFVTELLPENDGGDR